jgi:hypothetical protein
VEAHLVEFSKLYTNGENEHMDFEEFKTLNKKTLRIDTSKWLDDHSRLDRSKIPKQVVAPPGVKPSAVKRDFNQAFNNKNDRIPYRGQRAPMDGGGNGRGGGRMGGRGAYRYKREQPDEEPPANKPIPNKQPKLAASGICIRNTLNLKDPAKFPTGCIKPDCQHRHDVVLTGAGKLSPPDKERVMKTLTDMPGNFAKTALAFITKYM